MYKIRISDLELLFQCDLKFAFGLVRTPTKVTPAAERGIKMHKILEGVLTGNVDTKLANEFPEYTIALVDWVKQNVLSVISVEQLVDVDLGDGFSLVGKVDCILEMKDRGVVLYDLKTSQSSLDGVLYSPQLTSYITVFGQNYNVEKLGVLGFQKKRIVDITRDICEYDIAYAASLLSTAKTMVLRNRFVKRAGPHCSWCDFVEYCSRVPLVPTLKDIVVSRQEVESNESSVQNVFVKALSS